ncbi:MAG TPA: AraC family transcriptional regulator [Steroidobacteraceae bacterium]|nr:AraC family transcriptional regulator [Steroidobacteraceae bacterium]
MTQRKSHHESYRKSGSLQLLAAAPGYRIYDMRCTLGPRDPANENQYPAYRVAAIVGGTFKIRTTLGDAVPVVGSLLLGNARDCYCCSHDTPNGDRCINFDFEAGFLEQVRAELGMRGIGERFRNALIPPSRESVALAAAMEAVEEGSDTAALQEAAFEIAAAALTSTHATVALGRKSSFRNERAVMRVARYIDTHYHEPCSLDELAAQAGMSPFHFLRVYRRVTGQTPHRHVLTTRLRHAARRLRTSHDRIAHIALEVGFGDVSHFNASFASHFRVGPRAYRARFTQFSRPTTGCVYARDLD